MVPKNKQTLDIHLKDEFDTEIERDKRIENYQRDYNLLKRNEEYDLFFTKGMSDVGKFCLYTTYRYRRPETHRQKPIDYPVYDFTKETLPTL